MNIEKLSTLSDEALLTLADKLGLIVPAGLDRSFLVEALLEALAEDSEEREEALDSSERLEETKYGGTDTDILETSLDSGWCSDSRYNETMIRLLVRDTAWAFAFWDVNDEERAQLRAGEPGMGFQGLFLRVMEEGGDAPRNADHFDIPVEESDLQWYINLPQPDSRYRIDLCCRTGGKTRVLARSNVVQTPRGALAEDSSAMDGKTVELLALSGFGELDIPPSEDRHPSRILSGSEVEE